MKAARRSREIVRDPVKSDNVPGAPFAPQPLSLVHRADASFGVQVVSDLIATFGSTSEPGEVARRATERLATLSGCTGAFFYSWDADLDQFSLSYAAPAERTLAIEDAYAVGEGLIGRAALQPTVQGTLNAASPTRGRARTTPAPRSAALATRITSRDQDLVGALVVAGEESFAHAPLTARIAQDAGRLIALAAERDRSRAAAQRHHALLETIDVLARSTSADVPLRDALGAIAAVGLRATGATVCAIYIADRAHGDVRLAASAPRGVDLPAAWRLGEGGTRSDFPSLLTLPATTGTERVGLVVVADERPRRFTPEEREIGERLAGAAAIAIRQRQLLDGSTERTRPEDLLWEIVRPGGADPAATAARAKRLGCALTEPRVVLSAAASPGGSTDRLRAAILGLDRGALVDSSDDRLVAIVAAAAATSIDGQGCSVGLSQPCRELSRYVLAYEQAQEALELGQRLFGAAHVVRFDDLGSYRFVPALIQGGLTDEREYRQVSTLADELLRTLEAYLDSGGNTALAAKQLFLHRNTLRQRLERISAQLDLDLSAPSRWLPLQLAVKTARLSRLARPTTPK